MLVAIDSNLPETGTCVGRRRARAAGFTVIEILTSLAIITILTAIAFPAIQGIKNRQALARARSELALLAQALEEFRRHYGDYPQTGGFAQAPADRNQELATVNAQAKFFNALTGVFGPQRFAAGHRLDGRCFVELGKFVLESAVAADFPAARGSPPQRMEERTCFIDPWRRRYFYCYKSADNPQAWRSPGYVLYSAGPDGRHNLPDLLTGLYAEGHPAATDNADNISGSLFVP